VEPEDEFLRKYVLIFDHIFSMGLSIGEYGPKRNKVASVLFMTPSNLAWQGALSVLSHTITKSATSFPISCQRCCKFFIEILAESDEYFQNLRTKK
jgi:hypothetical protein